MARRPSGRRVRHRSAAPAAPGREHEGFDVRLAWEQELGKAGWVGLGWPADFGGRGASLTQQVIFAEEYTRAGAPGAGQPHGGEPARARPSSPSAPASSRSVSCRRSSGARSCGARATPSPTPAPTWPTCRPGRCCPTTAPDWLITGQKVWTSLAHWADWCFVVCRTEPGSPAPPGPVVPPRAPRASRAWTSARSCRSPGRRSSTRSSSTRPRADAGNVVGGGRRRLEGGHGHPRIRAGRVDAGPADRLRARAQPDHRPGPGQRPLGRSRSCASGSSMPGSACG